MFYLHTGEKIFTCDLCQKKFSRSGGLQRHKLTHDVPRVPCKYSAYFQRSKMLKLDYRFILGPYCDKMFTTKKGLVNHVGIHTGEVRLKG